MKLKIDSKDFKRTSWRRKERGSISKAEIINKTVKPTKKPPKMGHVTQCTHDSPIFFFHPLPFSITFSTITA